MAMFFSTAHKLGDGFIHAIPFLSLTTDILLYYKSKTILRFFCSCYEKMFLFLALQIANMHHCHYRCRCAHQESFPCFIKHLIRRFPCFRFAMLFEHIYLFLPLQLHLLSTKCGTLNGILRPFKWTSSITCERTEMCHYEWANNRTDDTTDNKHTAIACTHSPTTLFH